jgi:hypothetical protein
MAYRELGPSPYQSRSFQARLLGWLALGCIAVVAFNFVSTRAQKPTDQIAPPGKINYRVVDQNSSDLEADEFLLAPDNNSPDGPPVTPLTKSPNRRGPKVIELDASDSLQGSLTNPARAGASQLTREILEEVQIDRRILADVRDNTLGVRSEEADPFFRLLAHTLQTPASSLAMAARKDVLYLNLMTESDTFRGELVSISGDLRRLNRFPASENPYGVVDLYEGWVFTADSGTNPYRVVCTVIPKDMPTGEAINLPVRVSGYFFKREGYETPGGLHVAPLLLAKTIAWNLPPSLPPTDPGIAPYLIGSLIFLCALLGGVLFFIAVADTRSQRRRVASKPAMSDELLEDLRRRDVKTVYDTLDELMLAEQAAKLPHVEEIVDGAERDLSAEEIFERQSKAPGWLQGETEPAEPRRQWNSTASLTEGDQQRVDVTRIAIADPLGQTNLEWQSTSNKTATTVAAFKSDTAMSAEELERERLALEEAKARYRQRESTSFSQLPSNVSSTPVSSYRQPERIPDQASFVPPRIDTRPPLASTSAERSIARDRTPTDGFVDETDGRSAVNWTPAIAQPALPAPSPAIGTPGLATSGNSSNYTTGTVYPQPRPDRQLTNQNQYTEYQRSSDQSLTNRTSTSHDSSTTQTSRTITTSEQDRSRIVTKTSEESQPANPVTGRSGWGWGKAARSGKGTNETSSDRRANTDSSSTSDSSYQQSTHEAYLAESSTSSTTDYRSTSDQRTRSELSTDTTESNAGTTKRRGGWGWPRRNQSDRTIDDQRQAKEEAERQRSAEQRSPIDQSVSNAEDETDDDDEADDDSTDQASADNDGNQSSSGGKRGGWGWAHGRRKRRRRK